MNEDPIPSQELNSKICEFLEAPLSPCGPASIELEATGNSFLFTMLQGCEGGNPSLYVKEEVEEEDIDEYMDILLKAFKINTTKF